MAEGDSLTCPSCGGNKFVEVQMRGHWSCYSGGGSSGSDRISVRMTEWPIEDEWPPDYSLDSTHEACSTCGIIILRVGVDALKSAAGKWARAEKKKEKAAAEAKKKKSAEKAARTRAKNRREKKAKEIKKLKQKIKRLEDS